MKFSVIFVFVCLWFGVEARCRMRGYCAEVGGHMKPCYVDEEATPFTAGLSEQEAQDAAEMLASICPLIATTNGTQLKPFEEMLTCCTPEQITDTRDSLIIAEGVLGRCPICMRNFATQICEMNCSPDQSRFINVYPESTADGIEYVNMVDYRIHGEFMDGMFDSCADVLMPQTGLPAVNMMCGNAPVCNADAWLTFTGDTAANPISPLQVNFLRWNTTEDSMSLVAPACNETLEGDLPCSCIDCIVMCPLDVPVVPSICTVMSINCYSFSVAIVFFVVTVTFFIILTIISYKRLGQIDSKPDVTSNTNKITNFLQKLFAKFGLFSVNQPILVLMLTSWLVFSMIFGILFNLNLTSDPVELWSSPESRSRIELNYYNSRFGPFYRASQIFLTFDLERFESNNVTYGPAFRFEAIQELINLEDDVFKIGEDDNGVTLEQVCYAPNRPPGSEMLRQYCVHQSATIYLGDEIENLNNETYLNSIVNCLNNHYGFGCLADWGGGAEPELTFGGTEDDILLSDTLLITFPLTNHLLSEDLEPVLEWESKFIQLLQNYEANKPEYVRVAFGTERSIEDEIERISLAEIVPIAISYIIMFAYVVIALGNIRSWKTWIVDSKVSVAIGSFLIVIFSIACSLGTMSYMNVTVTLLSINVIPFFILSVGTDNVFLMINTIQDIQNNLKSFDDYSDDMSLTKKRNYIFEKMLIRVGPSMFVSSVTQITCFAIGTIANFPAVRTFAVFASFSLGYLFLFQMTTVIAMISLDFMRSQKNRFDILCCIRKKILDDENPLHADAPYKSVIQRLMKPYSKFILNWRVKICVAIIFMTMVSLSVLVIPHLEIGLDQEMALPEDSYVYRYLVAVNQLMRLGPPVFFVLKSGLNFTNIDHQNAICGGQMCNLDSLTTQIFLASRYTNITYVSRSSNSWLDDFVDWTNLQGACCKYNISDGSFCPSQSNEPECAFCEIEREEWANGLRPTPEAFEKYIPFFLQDAPFEICNKGGLASYGGGVNYILDSEGLATVYDTNFMAYHATLTTSEDYINAVKYGYEISENITQAIRNYTGVEVEVFPYSVFYVFFEQYLTMWGDTFASLGYCLIGATFFNLLASGFSFTTTFTVMVTTIMVLVNMMGVMWLWSIPLNPVSNINLIVSIGIAVEFCSHIVYAYNISDKPHDERVGDALESVGATIITGITLTNIPIIVLAFSYTDIIEVFFFRMLFSIVVLGFLHGMVFYPVFLSYVTDLGRKK